MKKYNPCEYRKTVRMGNGKWFNQCEYRKMVESVQAAATIEAKPIFGHGGLDALVEEKFGGVKVAIAPHHSIAAAYNLFFFYR